MFSFQIFVGSRRELVANSIRVGVGGVYWALLTYLLTYLLILTADYCNQQCLAAFQR